MTLQTVAIIAAGSMGSAVASRLTSHGITVLTSLNDRSPSTRKRALEAGMKDISFDDIPRRASIFLSILPPSQAETLAQDYIRAYNANTTELDGGEERIYVDCNAVSPQTVKRIAKGFEGVRGIRFVDAGIIGGPPREGYDPTFYASSDDLKALASFEGLGEFGMKITGMKGEGAGIGDASALKMSYAGITKGITGLFTTMILSAHASSPTTSNFLLNELNASQPQLLQRMTRSIPDMLPKAYRWVGEMREISEFVKDPAGNPDGGSPAGDGMDHIHEGMACVYERIEKAMNGQGDDKEVLEEFVKDAKEAIERKAK